MIISVLESINLSSITINSPPPGKKEYQGLIILSCINRQDLINKVLHANVVLKCGQTSVCVRGHYWNTFNQCDSHKKTCMDAHFLSSCGVLLSCSCLPHNRLLLLQFYIRQLHLVTAVWGYAWALQPLRQFGPLNVSSALQHEWAAVLVRTYYV